MKYFGFRSPFPATGILAICFGLALTGEVRAQEFRAFWVDAFGPGFKSASEVTTLINNVRAANANAIVPEIRKRGDAYYNGSIYEPKPTDISPSFDPLQDMITKAHDTSGGKPRIEVHAWIVSYKIWGNQSTPPAVSTPPHPYNAHPDWLTEDINGATWDGTSYSFDPGHPDVQRFTYDVCMDIISRYDIDGFNFDYIRYTGNTWGYHPVTVARFNAKYNQTGQPSPTDPDWKQFRRDQVTALVRKVYLNTMAIKPWVKISADTITWGNSGVANETQWYNSSEAYHSVLQDWRSWMEEGILDLNIPMNYYRHHNKTPPTDHATAFTNWMNFAKDHKYNRHLAIGPGVYLNYASNSIIQMRATRAPSPLGNYAEGVCGYSYRTPDNQGTGFSTFRSYLTNSPNANDPISPAIFNQPVSPPVMPWKASPTTGHLKGFVYGDAAPDILDGASLTISGPVNRTLETDATGFYGAVDLPPGNYSVQASFAGYQSQSALFTITAGAVTTIDLTLPVSGAPVIVTQPQNQVVNVGEDVTFSVTASGTAPLSYQWKFGGTDIPGATDSSYTQQNVLPGDAGGYSVVISNEIDSVTSGSATLTVNVPAGPPQLHAANWSAGEFSLTLTGQTGESYWIEASVNLIDWVPLTLVVVSGGQALFTDPETSSYDRRFYRARLATSEQLISDFESYPAGTGALFRHPSFSGPTSSYIETSPGTPNFSLVSDAFPPGHGGAQVLHVAWTFKVGITPNTWLRLTTFNALQVPNPTIGFQQTLQFDVYADRELYLAIGLRETGTAAPIGGDGGFSGLIEWVGGSTDNTSTPPKGRLIAPGQWTTVEFAIPNEPIKAYTGNAMLESATGKGVLEQLAIAPLDGELGPYNIYLDNFVVREPSP